MLPTEFPHVVWGPSFGQWWRVHGAGNGAWWFSSSDHPTRPDEQIGRFDLPRPFGTCYVGACLAGAASESLRETGVGGPAEQQAAEQRRMSQMPLDQWYGQRIADFTSPEASSHGVPDDIAQLPRVDARPWAMRAHAGGFQGILYELREDPGRRIGLAVFGSAGEHEPKNAVAPVELPVGLRHELQDLFDGAFRGDPIPR